MPDDITITLADDPPFEPFELNIPDGAIEEAPQRPLQSFADTYVPYATDEEVKPKRRGGRPKGSKNKSLLAIDETPIIEPISIDWLMILELANMFVEKSVSKEARINEIEQSFIVQGLSGMTKEVPREVMQKASMLINVVFLGLALTLWLWRVKDELIKKRAEEAKNITPKPLGASDIKAPSPSELTPQSANGHQSSINQNDVSDVPPSFLFDNTPF